MFIQLTVFDTRAPFFVNIDKLIFVEEAITPNGLTDGSVIHFDNRTDEIGSLRVSEQYSFIKDKIENLVRLQNLPHQKD
jgi:hypothetical protein